jgi:hypothetical protein
MNETHKFFWALPIGTKKRLVPLQAHLKAASAKAQTKAFKRACKN